MEALLFLSCDSLMIFYTQWTSCPMPFFQVKDHVIHLPTGQHSTCRFIGWIGMKNVQNKEQKSAFSPKSLFHFIVLTINFISFHLVLQNKHQGWVGPSLCLLNFSLYYILIDKRVQEWFFTRIVRNLSSYLIVHV